MIEATQKKLREAQYFLHRLLNEGQKPLHNESEEFAFCLSAFLSAARSVTFALQYEEKANYDGWFLPWFEKLSAEDQDLFGFLKDQRNNVQKRGGADVISASEFVPITPLWTELLALTPFGFPSFGEEVFPTQVSMPVLLFQSKHGDKEVMEACKRYMELLETLVKDFLTNNGP
jgi:hypothetical protein